MSMGAIIAIVATSIVVFLALLIIVMRIRGKKNEKKLNSNLEKYKNENASIPKDDISVTIINDEKKAEEEQKVEEEKVGVKPIIEDYISANSSKNYRKRSIFDDEDFSFDVRRRRANRERIREEKDDFDEFLNQHSYTRRILDKDMLNKLKSLPPEIKAIILSNVFSRHEDL